MSYDSSFQEYCSTCERPIIHNTNSIYCSKDCENEDYYNNVNPDQRRLSINFLKYGILPPDNLPNPLDHIKELEDEQRKLNFHDYSLSAIQNNSSYSNQINQSSQSYHNQNLPASALSQYYSHQLKIGDDLDSNDNNNTTTSNITSPTKSSRSSSSSSNYNNYDRRYKTFLIPNQKPQLSPKSKAYFAKVQRERESFR